MNFVLCETFIKDFSGDLYGKYMTVYFDKYLREIKKFESEDALKAYAVHPEHVAVADGKVRPYTANRSCLDFEV